MKKGISKLYLVTVLGALTMYASVVALAPSPAFGGAAGSQGPNGPDTKGGSTGTGAGGKKAGNRYTGLGPGGIWGDWEVRADGVHVHVGPGKLKNTSGPASSGGGGRGRSAGERNCGKC